MKKLSMDELNRITPEQFKEQQKIPLVVVLDSIRSMNNVGSVFRTCDAFKVEKLYLCGITACPPNKSVIWEYAEDVVQLAQRLQKDGYKVFVVEQVDESVMLQDMAFQTEDKIAVIVGNEVFGVDERLLPVCDGAIEIPQFGTKHSLNVTIAAGIVIWEIAKQYLKLEN